MKLVRYFVAISAFVCVCPAIKAETDAISQTAPLTLTKVNDVVRPGRSSCAISDPTYRMTFEQIRARETTLSCEANGSALPSFGLARAAIWLKFRVVNETNERIWYLQLMPNIDRIEYYQVDEAGRQTRASVAGRGVPYAEYEIGHRNHLFTLEVPPGEAATVYLRIQSEGPLWADMSLFSRHAFLTNEQREQFIFGGYFATLLVIALLNLFFLLATRKAVYVYYIAYLLSFSLNMLSSHGYLYQIFWPESPEWNAHAPASLALTTVFFATFFATAFLEYPEPSAYNKTMKFLRALLVVPGVILTFSGSLIGWFLLIPTLLVAAAMTFLGGIHRLIQGYRPAAFYVVGWCMLLLFMFAHALALMKIIPFEFISHYYLLAASGLEMLFFTMALAYRHYLLGREKDFMAGAIQSERDRLAGEIHDSLGAELTSMIMKLESRSKANKKRRSRKKQNSPGRADDDRDFSRRLRSTLQKLRDIVYLMKNHTAVEKPVSVTVEIQEFAERLTATGQCRVQCELSPADEAALQIKNNLHVVRIFQEWMTNIVRHTSSKSIRVRWRARGGRRYLSIQNDDAVFQWRHSTDLSAEPALGRGVGLESIRWRTRELGGRARAMRLGTNTIFVLSIPEQGGR